MISKDPFRFNSGEPFITKIGEAVDKADIPYIQLAADELNSRLGTDTYVLENPTTANIGPDGHKLPVNMQTIRLTGSWAVDHPEDLSELVEQVEQIKANFGDMAQDFDGLY